MIGKQTQSNDRLKCVPTRTLFFNCCYSPFRQYIRRHGIGIKCKYYALTTVIKFMTITWETMATTPPPPPQTTTTNNNIDDKFSKKKKKRQAKQWNQKIAWLMEYDLFEWLFKWFLCLFVVIFVFSLSFDWDYVICVQTHQESRTKAEEQKKYQTNHNEYLEWQS